MKQVPLLCTLIGLLPLLCHGAEPALTIIEPRPRSGLLLNPGKGWSGFGTPKHQPKEVLAFLGLGVARFHWADIEPQEGQFDWAPIERFLAAWAREGKVCNVSVMCANTHTRDPEGYVTPKWVFAAGARKIEIDLKPDQSTTGTSGRKVAPVFDDPVFLEKLRHFLRAFAARYDGDPRIAILDIRSYGNWGEAHMHPFGVPDIAAERFREHVQMHLDAFKKTQLCISRNAHLGNFGPLKSVFDWAVLEHSVAPRRDGICGNSDGQETAIGYGIAPGLFELFDSYDGTKQRGWWDGKKDKSGMGFRLEECIEKGKPTWVDLGRGGESGLRMLQENRELIERLSNRIGYHFHLKRAEYSFQPSGDLTIRVSWTNQGVAPIYIPCSVAIALLAGDGTATATRWPETFQPRQWMPGTLKSEEARLSFSGIPAGKYRLGLALTPKTGEATPYVRLGTELPEVNGWLILGEVKMSDPR